MLCFAEMWTAYYARRRRPKKRACILYIAELFFPSSPALVWSGKNVKCAFQVELNRLLPPWEMWRTRIMHRHTHINMEKLQAVCQWTKPWEQRIFGCFFFNFYIFFPCRYENLCAIEEGCCCGFCGVVCRRISDRWTRKSALNNRHYISTGNWFTHWPSRRKAVQRVRWSGH